MSELSLGMRILRSFESCRLKSYPDPATGGKPWTCGWGSTGADVGPGTVWTQEQADARLEHDWQHFRSQVEAMLEVDLTDDQIDALTDFAYNEGVHKLAGSTLLAHINAGEHDETTQIEKWHFAAGKDMKGLRERREAEAALFTGDTQGVETILSEREPAGAEA